MFERFPPATFSLATMADRAQISITNGTGAAACALAEDQQRSLGASVQLIVHLPSAVSGTCPIGEYSVSPRCETAIGSDAYVPAGCAFYRQWDAQGETLGVTAALNGLITVSGTEASCSFRMSLTFLGGSFAETLRLSNGVPAQTWCVQ